MSTTTSNSNTKNKWYYVNGVELTYNEVMAILVYIEYKIDELEIMTCNEFCFDNKIELKLEIYKELWCEYDTIKNWFERSK